MAEQTKTAETKDNKGTDETLGDSGLRALEAERQENRELRAQLKELQSKVDTAEQEKLSKEERLQAQLTEAQNKVKALEQAKELDTIRRDVAKTAGIPEHLLHGDSKEALEASAKAYKEHIEELTGSKTPEPNPYLGNDPGNGSDPDTEARKILGFP